MYLDRFFFKNLLKVGGATFIAQLVGIVTVPIFARLFAPDVVGQFALFTSAVGILGVFSTGRYEYALMLPKESIKAFNILIGTIIISLLWFFILLIFIYFAENFIVQIGDYRSISTYFYLLPVFVLLASILRLFQFWSNREKEFGFNAKLNLSNSMISKFGNITLGYMGFVSLPSLIFVNLFVQLIEFGIRFISLFKKRTRIYWKQLNRISIQNELIRYKRFPLLDVWNEFLNTGSLLIVPIILSIYFSATDVGLYSQSLTLIQLPLALIASAFGQIFFQRLCEAKHSNELPMVVSEAFVFLFLFAAPIFLVIGFWGREIFSVVLGERWSLSGTYAELLAPWCFLKMLFSPLSTILSVTERQDLSLLITVLTLFTRVLSIVIGGIYGSCYLAVLLFGISGVITNLVGIFILIYLSNIKTNNIRIAISSNPLIVFIKKL